MKRLFVKSKSLSRIFLNAFLYNNPVLIGSMGVCMVVACGFTLKSAVAIIFLTIFTLFPSVIISNLFFKKIEHCYRVPLIVLIATIVFCSVCYLWLPDLLRTMPSALGIYAPTMIISSMVINRADKYAVTHNLIETIVNGIGVVFGFSLVIIITSIIREILAFGTVWEKTVIENYTPINSITLPFVGFIILAFFSAFIKSLRNKKEKRESRRRINKSISSSQLQR